jgi:fatty acid desaturase
VLGDPDVPVQLSVPRFLAGPTRTEQDAAVGGTPGLRPNRTQAWSAAATLLSYAVGYPLALVADSALGWVLVMLGGVFLLAFICFTVARVHRGAEANQPDAPVRSP